MFVFTLVFIVYQFDITYIQRKIIFIYCWLFNFKTIQIEEKIIV